MPEFLEFREITKCYGTTVALDNFSMKFKPGITFAVGPNGAGKSTLLRLAAGVTRQTAGNIIIGDFDVRFDPMKARRCISYLSDTVPLYGDLSVEEHLTYRGRLKGLSGQRLRARLRHVMERLDLISCSRERTRGLSAGLRKRVGIADSVLTDTRFLLIDEPFAGVDSEHIRLITAELTAAAKHSTVILATHRLDIAETIQGTCAVLGGGVLAGTIPSSSEEAPLRERYEKKLSELTNPEDAP